MVRSPLWDGITQPRTTDHGLRTTDTSLRRVEELRVVMYFSIQHTTEYRFTRPVFFEPHQLRFQPRSDAAQRLIRARSRDRACPGRLDAGPRHERQHRDHGLV